MSGLKAKLTQKIGPLPAFVWALLLVGIYLAYRKFHSASTDTATTDATATDPGIIGTGVGGDAGTAGDGTSYHDPIPLDPGQSIYDPNTRNIVTGPTPAPDANVEPSAPVPPPSDDSAPSPAAQTVAAPHPGSSAVVVSSALHNAAVSAAVKAAATQAKPKPAAHTVKPKAHSPAIHTKKKGRH